MRVGSLFSGIGGLDLGLERAGMTVAWQAEVDPYCCQVLAKHWPDVPNLGDVTTIDWKDVPRVDLICGGYPCQPFSYAGDRKGEHDDRHLWPYFADALRHLRPRFALLENVPGHLSLGFGRVLGDLADLGYDAEWDCIPASAVGAPHRRFRVFVVADSQRTGLQGHRSGSVWPRSTPRGGAVGNTIGSPEDPHATAGSPRHPASESGWWRTEPDVGRVADGVPSRVDRLRGLGNAVVPQVAQLVGERIAERVA